MKFTQGRWKGISVWEYESMERIAIDEPPMLDLRQRLDDNYQGTLYDENTDTTVYFGGVSNCKKILPDKQFGTLRPYRISFYYGEVGWNTEIEEWLLQGRRRRYATVDGDIYFTVFASSRPDAERNREVFWEYLQAPHVCEMWSPPRPCRMAHRIGTRAGWSLDLQTGYDLSDQATRAWANEQLKADDPWLTLTCPPCGPMSQLNIGLNYPKTPIDTVTDKLNAGLEHLNYTVRHGDLRATTPGEPVFPTRTPPRMRFVGRSVSQTSPRAGGRHRSGDRHVPVQS